MERRSMRLEIRERILLCRSLAKFLDGELRPPVITGNFNLHFNDIAGLKRVGAGLEVVPHLGFALSGPVGQAQRQVGGPVTLAAELLLRDGEKLRDRLPFVFRDIAEEDGFGMRGKQRALTHERRLTAAAVPGVAARERSPVLRCRAVAVARPARLSAERGHGARGSQRRRRGALRRRGAGCFDLLASSE